MALSKIKFFVLNLCVESYITSENFKSFQQIFNILSTIWDTSQNLAFSTTLLVVTSINQTC